jgi:molybdate transport system permease protein
MTAEEWRLIAFTLEIATLSTILIAPFGMAIAWLLARFAWRGKAVVETIVMLPLVMPPVATGLLLLKLFGRRGLLGRLNVVFTWRAVVVAVMVMSFPLFVRAARVAFEEVDRRFEQVARTLGAHRVRVFFTISLPLAARGIVAGVVLAFARAIGEFGATIIVAGDIPGRTRTLALAIYSDVELGHDAAAYHLLIVAVIIAFTALLMSEVVLRKRSSMA